MINELVLTNPINSRFVGNPSLIGKVRFARDTVTYYRGEILSARDEALRP